MFPIKIKLPAAPAILTLVLAVLFCVPTHAAKEEKSRLPPLSVKGIWGFSPALKPFEGKTPEEIARTLSDWGVNLVFGGYKDGKLAAALHNKGIRIIAEISCFHGETHWKSHPESRPIDKAGKRIKKVRWYAGVCPSQEWLRKKIVQKAGKLAVTKGVDGIWLDFMRYPTRWEVPEPDIAQTCFCKTCLTNFSSETGVAVPDRLRTASQKADWILTHHPKHWASWKCRNIAGLVRQVRKEIKSKNPECLLGIFTVPWLKGDYGNAMIHVIGQDYKLLAPFVDVFSPMTYHFLNKRPRNWISKVVKRVHHLTHKPVWPIICVGEGKNIMGARKMRKTIRTAFRPPSEGVLVLSLRALVDGNLLPTLQKSFSASNQ